MLRWLVLLHTYEVHERMDRSSMDFFRKHLRKPLEEGYYLSTPIALNMHKALLLVTLASFSTLNAQVVINEVEYDQPGTDNAEFIELKNIGTEEFPVSDLRVVLVNGNNGGSEVYRTIENAAWPALPSGAFFVICANEGLTLNCDHVATPTTNLVQNGSPDAIALVRISSEEIIDALSYGGSVPGYTEGNGTTLEDTNEQDGISLCRFPDGADSDDNSMDFVLGCPTPGVANLVDPVNCDVSTAVRTVDAGSSFTVQPSSDGQHFQVLYQTSVAGPVAFAVFTTDGRLIAEQELMHTRMASWSFPVYDLHGRSLILRATSYTGMTVRRVVVP